MDSEEPATAKEQEMQVVQQQPQLDSEGRAGYSPSKPAGGDPTMSTHSDAPPDYSEIEKELLVPVHLPVQVDQPHHQAELQPGTVQYMVPGGSPNIDEKYRASHDFLTVSVYVSVLCGFINPATLFCTIPAVILSYQSFKSQGRADYQAANRYSNCALGLTVAAIITAVVLAMVGVGTLLGVVYHH